MRGIHKQVWDANKVTQPHKRLKMKRDGDKGKERQGNLMGLWQPYCLIWKRLRFHGWGVVSSASGSGPQMDYSKSNHNTWIWDAFGARECSLLFATFYVCPSSSVHHPSSSARHQSLPMSASTAYSCLPSLARTFCSGLKKANVLHALRFVSAITIPV